MTGSQPPTPLAAKPEGSTQYSAHRRKPVAFQTNRNSGVLLGLLAMLTLFSACEWPGLKSAPLREPPLIPSPPAAASPAEAMLETHVANFADQEAIQNFSPTLPQAMAHALTLHVLKPATPQAQFEPERAITYGEFRQWANDYQNALIDMKTQANAISGQDSAPAVAGPLAPPASIAAHLGNPTLLPAEMRWGAHGVREINILNRESFCALAVFLNGQDAAARRLTSAQIASATLGPDMENSAIEPPDGNEGSLDQLADFDKISPWAQRYVALAYKNDWFQPVFNLSMAQITTAEGLHPAQAVTRGEALLLLDLLYGQHQPSANAAHPAASWAMSPPMPTAPSRSQSKQEFQGSPMPPRFQQDGQTQMTPSKSDVQTLPKQPLPLSHMQSIRENGPQGSRSAIRMEGP
jgi:hypothetical protein